MEVNDNCIGNLLVYSIIYLFIQKPHKLHKYEI